MRTIAAVAGLIAVAACSDSTATREVYTSSGPIALPAGPVATIQVTPSKAMLRIGTSSRLTALAKDASGLVVSNVPVSWRSSDTTVATVSDSGMLRAKSVGSTSVIASADNVSASASIAVSSVPVASIAVSLGSSSIQVGSTTIASAVTKDSSGAVLSDRIIAWSSSAPSVATVNSSGVVTGVSAGSATIIATSEGIVGNASISITTPPPAPVASVTVTLNAPSLTPGQSTQATVVLKDAAGNTLTGRTVTWTSSAPSVATVSSSGLVQALVAGSTSITATSGGISGQATLTVTATPPPPPAPVASVSVSLSSSSLTTGQTTQATAVLRDASGNVLTGRTISWTSANVALATVSASGVVTAVAAGSVNIVATSEGISGQAGLTVSAPAPAPVATVTVSLGSANLLVGQGTQASVVLKDASGNVLTGRVVTWSSGNTAIATVNASGAVTAVASGSTGVIATSEGKTGSATVTVSNPPPPPPPSGSEPIYVAGQNTSLLYEDFETYSDAASFQANGWAPHDVNLLSAPAGTGFGGGRAAQISWLAGTTGSGFDGGVPTNGEGRVAIFTFMYRTSAGFKVDNVGKKYVIMNLGDPDRVTTGLTGSGGAGAWDFLISGYFGGTQDVFAAPTNQAFTPQSVGEYLTNGSWHRVTIRRTQSSSGNSPDGSIEIWVDGVKTHNQTGLMLGTQPIFNVEFSGTWNLGSPQAQTEWFDNVRIWY